MGNRITKKCSKPGLMGLQHGLTIKTSNPKCRLYWCLIEFRDWKYSRSCLIFSTPLVSLRPSNLLTD